MSDKTVLRREYESVEILGCSGQQLALNVVAYLANEKDDPVLLCALEFSGDRSTKQKQASIFF